MCSGAGIPSSDKMPQSLAQILVSHMTSSVWLIMDGATLAPVTYLSSFARANSDGRLKTSSWNILAARS